MNQGFDHRETLLRVPAGLTLLARNRRLSLYQNSINQVNLEIKRAIAEG